MTPSSPSMHDDREPATIVIAGGGIVGLVLAMKLQKELGITPEVYEKSSHPITEAGAGLGMYPNGLRVLRDISPDLLRAVRGAGYPYKTRRWERHDGTEIMQADENALLGQTEEEQKDDPEKHLLSSIGIRRSKLQVVLLAYARHMGIRVVFDMPVESAVQQEDGLVQVTFANGSQRWTRVLFGADGAHSKVRATVTADEEVQPALEYTGVTCLMGLSKTKSDGIAFPSSDMDDFHAVFFPTAADETCFQFHVPVPEDQANALNWGNLSDQIGRAECRKIAKHLRAEGWHEKYIEPLENAIQAVRVGFALMEPRLTKWVKGRIALVGDSAHPPVPYIGQGAQQGLEDAGVVTALLKVYCLNKDGTFDPTNFEKAITLYQEIRIKRSSQILNFSKSLGRMQADRSCAMDDEAKLHDNALKGEVLMYGTLPIMLPGATHDYKDDIKRVSEKVNLPQVNADEAMDALEKLLGFVPPTNEAITMANTTNPQNENQSQPSPTDIDKSDLERHQLLVNWLVEGLEVHLKRIMKHHQETGQLEFNVDEAAVQEAWTFEGHAVVDEVQEIVEIPHHERDTILAEKNPMGMVLPIKASQQLRAFVLTVTTLYRKNPFHNFEHACNVTMAVSKFLTRMSIEKGTTLTLNDRTFGIVADPLTQFAIVFAALLHDAEHLGVPNTQLLVEHPEMAKKYKNKAIAEQHSVDVAFDILMEPKYRDLRMAIYKNEKDMRRFRQLVVNVILATDICDKDLKDFRNRRWERAFSDPSLNVEEVDDLKATIGIETLIQASDIHHTMQPWKVYKEWNQKLFTEMFKAFQEGRSTSDPRAFWFKGEVGFFDFYIIPLAKKLETCELFGSMSAECLSYAKANREAWLRNGPEDIDEMIRKVTLAMGTPIPTVSAE